MASKIVVVGPVNGRFETVFTKLAKLHAKTSFSLALIAGDLFSNPGESSDEDKDALDSLLNGTFKVPLPTYFTVGQHAIPPAVIERIEANDGEVCTNLYFLSKRSTTTTSEGIRIVVLGGLLDMQIAAGESKDRFLPFHTESDARTLRGANRADILLTTHWPLGIQQGSKVELRDGIQAPRAEQCVADLCRALRPRYHFSTSAEVFWEREPFVQTPTEQAPNAKPVTRFISLASATATSKAKWLYAFSLDPKAPVITTAPAGSTGSPFALPAKKRASTSAHPSATTGMRDPKRRRKKALPPPGPNECYFCLANPNLSTHLLTSIGDAAYLTTARGPLVESSTYEELPFQSHILIIPLAHCPTLARIPDGNEARTTFSEMQRYRHALQSLIASRSKGAFGAVTWELSRAEGVHVHWQFLPLQRKLLVDGLAEAAFRVQAANADFPPLEARDIGDGSGVGDFFRVWLWTPDKVDGTTDARDGQVDGNGDDAENGAVGKEVSGKEVQLVLLLDGLEQRFDVMFGRRVLSQLLELEGPVAWKECIQTEAEETTDAEAFKAAFKAWDFAQEQ